MSKLGMSPAAVRSQAATIRGQLSALDDALHAVSTARSQGANPQSYGLQDGDRALSPSALASVGAAYNQVLAAKTAAENLLATLEAQIAEQEAASGAGAGVGGVDGPGGLTQNPNGPFSDQQIGPAVGPFVTTSSNTGLIADAEGETDEVSYKPGGGTNLDSVNPFDTDESGPGGLSGGLEGTARLGVGSQTSVTTTDGDETTTTESEVFWGVTGTGSVSGEMNDDGSGSVSGELGIGVGTSAQVSGSYENAETGLSAQGELSADVTAQATAGANAGVNEDGDLEVGVEVGASAMATAAAAGSATLGVATVSGNASVSAGARAEASATGTIGPDGVSANVGVSGFAGGEAKAEASGEAFGVEGTAAARVSYGIGFTAEADVELTMDKVEVSVDLGATLGIGGGFSFDVSFSPSEMANDLFSLFD